MSSHEATELRLYIANAADLHRQQGTAILRNLATKKARGDYKHDLAVKLYMYLVESGAKKYVKQFGTPDQPWHKLFSMADRKAVAEDLTRSFEEEYGYGNYDSLLPKKYQAAGTPAGARLKKSAARLQREIDESLASAKKGARR
jgi:hypothetical protein